MAQMIESRTEFYESRGVQAIPPFEECEFSASVRGAKLHPSGSMEVTIHIPMSEKYNAMTLTDAVGVMLLFRVERRRRSQARLALLTNLNEENPT